MIGLAAVALFGVAGAAFGDPDWHRWGLALAVPVGLAAILLGMKHRRRPAPLAVAFAGLVLMALALLAPHGPPEVLLTLLGVSLVAGGHYANLRQP